MKLIIEILLIVWIILLSAYFIPGISVDGYLNATISAISIAIANTTIDLILRFFALPLNILTFGLTSFIITMLMVLLIDKLMNGLNTTGFLAVAVLAIIIAVIKTTLNSIFDVEQK